MSISARRRMRAFSVDSIIDAIISDSFFTHDAIPRGVPAGYSWRLDADNDPNNSSTTFQSYGAMNTWGQIFVPEGGSANYAVRIAARNPKIWFFDGTVWSSAVVPSGDPYPMGGAYWTGDFNPSGSSSATIRQEADGSYSVSLQALSGGSVDVYHFWWDGLYPRITIPASVVGIVLRTEMRLIPDGAGTTTGAQFIGCICGDMFATPTTIIDPSGTNPGLPEPRMKWLTGEWQNFYDTTLSIAQLRANPPVLN